MGLRVEEFDYPLPKELIAQYPEQDRSASRLMVVDRKTKEVRHQLFRDLPEFLRKGDILVLNDTRVMAARLSGRRSTGGKVDILLVERVDGSTWTCLVGNGGRSRRMDVSVEGLQVSLRREENGWIAEFPGDVDEIMRDFGAMPLPHYIKRGSNGTNGTDFERYQTVYAEHLGSIAAPTAGLHFTEDLLSSLAQAGVAVMKLTHHVGVGTFRPVRRQQVEEHEMDAEYYTIPGDVASVVRRAKGEGRRIVAVGTTSVRALESAFGESGEGILQGSTRLFIYPGFRFKVVDALITNFHLPRSTPLLLASAFAGRDALLACYREAVERKYRFYSYGDAMFLV